MNKTFVLLLLAAIAGMGTTAGCYTMIKHPMADLSTEEDMASDEDCASCHSAQSEVWFPAPQGPWYPPPWWHDHDHGHDNDQGSSTPTEPEGRHLWERGPGAPSAPPGNGVVAPAPTPSPAPAVPGGSDTTGTPPRDREQNKDKDKDKNKGRNAWGR